MGSGLGEVAGFFYLWPLTFLAIIAVWICISLTEAEYDDGALTQGGKRMILSRIFLGIGCGIYCLCILLGHALTRENEQDFGFWDRHWHLFMAFVVAAEFSMLIAMVYGLQARGSRIWVIRCATVFIVILSTFVTILFLHSQ